MVDAREFVRLVALERQPGDVLRLVGDGVGKRRRLAGQILVHQKGRLLGAIGLEFLGDADEEPLHGLPLPV